MKTPQTNRRPFWKVASGSWVQGAYGTKDRSVFNIHEDLSTGATSQPAAEVEFTNRSIEIIECDNSFQLARLAISLAKEHEIKHFVVESDELKVLLAKHLCMNSNFKSYTEKFLSIAMLASDPENISYLIDLYIRFFPDISWLRSRGDSRSALEIISNKFGERMEVVSRAKEIMLCNSYQKSLELHISIFKELSGQSQYDFQFIDPELLADFQANEVSYIDALISIIQSHEIKHSSAYFLSFQELEDIQSESFILIENGLCNLEKEAKLQGRESLEKLLKDLTLILQNKKTLVLRNLNSNDEESIFYRLLSDKYPKNPVKPSSIIPKNPYEQPIASIPKELRPKKYSVTSLTKLMADPYCYYSEYILKLKRYDRIWEKNENRDFGIFVHKVVTKIDDPHALQEMLDSINTSEGNKLIWKHKLIEIINFLKNYYLTNPKVSSFIECEGEAKLLEDIIISSIADRIDITSDLEAIILDFKTGQAPSQSQVNSGLAPQLSIESWILSKAGFKISAPYKTIATRYLSLSGRPALQSFDDIKSNNEGTEASLFCLLNLFYTNAEGYFATYNENNREYAHIKRLDEWR
jgi:RecB family exonuclease